MITPKQNSSSPDDVLPRVARAGVQPSVIATSRLPASASTP
jgi:hypothetical protein